MTLLMTNSLPGWKTDCRVSCFEEGTRRRTRCAITNLSNALGGLDHTSASKHNTHSVRLCIILQYLCGLHILGRRNLDGQQPKCEHDDGDVFRRAKIESRARLGGFSSSQKLTIRLAPFIPNWWYSSTWAYGSVHLALELRTARVLMS
jgi:hypothetical protein